jgi:hypothetical protein
MKVTGVISIAAIAIYVAIGLAQLWFNIFDPVVFVKISITFATVICALVISALIRRDYVGEKKQKEQGFID